MKVEIVLIGEAFRIGGQGTRLRDVNGSYNQQKKACESHIKLADHLSNKGFHVSINIESYKTRYESDLHSWYGDRLKICSLRDNLVGIQELAKSFLNKTETCNCVFFCRIDLAIKDYFIDIFSPEWQKVMFPSVCWLLEHNCGDFPRVSDTMLFVPSKFINCVKNNFFLSHNAWFEYVNSKTLKHEDMGLMLDTYHDSDSAKDYNPIYNIVNRQESKFWRSMGCQLNEHLKPVQNWTRISFPDWSPKKIMDHDKVFSEDMWEWWHKDPFMDVFRFINLIQFEASGRIGYYNHIDQRYWKIENDSIVIMDENKKVSSIMNKISNEVYLGKFEFDNRITFMIRKAELKNWQ